ncbi:MAG: peptidylprolyl isomerase [Planctomycetes bacterium]|nr:peptidylprolyl isomerase [Planctomycetota bacterium]
MKLRKVTFAFFAIVYAFTSETVSAETTKPDNVSDARWRAYVEFIQEHTQKNKIDCIVEGEIVTTERILRPLLESYQIEQLFLSELIPLTSSEKEQSASDILLHTQTYAGGTRAVELGKIPDSRRQIQSDIIFTEAARMAGMDRLVRPSRVEAQVASLREMVIKQNASTKVDPGEWLTVVARRYNRKDITIDEVKSEIRGNMMREFYRQILLGLQGLRVVPDLPARYNLTVSPMEISDYYREHSVEFSSRTKYRYYRILVPTRQGESREEYFERAKEVADAFRAESIGSRSDFMMPDMDIQNSPEEARDDPQNLRQEFAAAFKSLDVNDVPDPIWASSITGSSYRYFVVCLLERPTLLTSREFQEEIEQELFERKRNDALFRLQLDHIVEAAIYMPDRSTEDMKRRLLEDYRLIRRMAN